MMQQQPMAPDRAGEAPQGAPQGGAGGTPGGYPHGGQWRPPVPPELMQQLQNQMGLSYPDPSRWDSLGLSYRSNHLDSEEKIE